MILWSFSASLLLLALQLCGGRNPPCIFNFMCTCFYGSSGGSPSSPSGHSFNLSYARVSMQPLRQVTCLGVPFARIPVFSTPSSMIDFVVSVNVVNSGVEVIGNSDFGDTKVENLILTSNNIRRIEDKAFMKMAYSLRTLDLGYNELTSVPRRAIRQLNMLEWLNLSGNHIVEILPQDLQGLENNLESILLSENDISYLPEQVLTKFSRLIWFYLDNNNIIVIKPGTLPVNIAHMSLNHNQLTSFPMETVERLQELNWLHLRGNLLDRIPENGFNQNKILTVLDLGENFIHFIPDRPFNLTLSVMDLHFEYNLLTYVQQEAFKSLNPARLFLSYNNIKNISEKAFLGGPDHTVEYLDLEKNDLTEIPKALENLKSLRYLYLPYNKIKVVPKDSFRSFCDILESLSLEGNQLTIIPRIALENCSRIDHLNLGHNLIMEINESDFKTWGNNLHTLILRSNKIYSIPPHAFRNTPKLRELSLSFNRIVDVGPDSLIDILNTLEIIEISFGFYRDDFPEEILKPLTSLQWIALDNNNFRTISETALYSFGNLNYFNMDSNRITQIPKTLFHQNVHTNLSDIRLAYNYIDQLDTHAFHNLENLRTVVLTGNKIKFVKFETFKSLPRLMTILLPDNEISSIENGAFSDLPNLIDLDLQKNKLTKFSLAAFNSVSGVFAPLSLNLSFNQITNLNPGTKTPVRVESLDVSHNLLKEVPINFLEAFEQFLQRLDMGFNRINKLDTSAFGELSRLQMIILEHNNIQQIRPKAFTLLNKVQLFDLSHNHIKILPHDCFSDMSLLRVLDLSHNHLRALPSTAFRDTKLETLRLTHNEFVSMPSIVLAVVDKTLHYLDISNNHIEHLDSTMFHSLSKLIELNIASNKLTILPDNVFVSLTSLVSLDLSSNPVRANFKELFHYTQKVQKLNIADIGITSMPVIPLPNLISLNVSRNTISEIEVHAIESLKQLRSLDLSYNSLIYVQFRIWHYMPFLKWLDLSNNPIQSLTKDSFTSASQIETLKLSNLDETTRFDYDVLSNMPFLRELYMNTFPYIEKYRFRVGHILATVHTLQVLHLDVRENALTDQLSGAFGPKLKELHITGKNLKAIDSKTFRGFQNKHQFLLSITDTSIRSLPDGLLTELSNVAYLSIDLRNNKLKFLDSHVLYENGSDWESKGTTYVAGGLALQGNDWSCDCSLVWLGRWLRRWLRETLQIHTVKLKRAHMVQQLAREATCFEPRTGQHVPLVDLNSEDLGCHASALSDTAASPPSPFTWNWTLILFTFLSMLIAFPS